MTELQNTSTRQQRCEYLQYIIRSIDSKPEKMEEFIYDLVGCSGLVFEPRDPQFTDICIQANVIEASPRPIWKDEYAQSEYGVLKKMVVTYCDRSR